MEGKTFLSEEPTYKALQNYYNKHGKDINILDMSKADPSRFQKYSVTLPTPSDGDILFDYSKNRINDEVLKLLFDLARSRKVETSRDEMFSGGKVTMTNGGIALNNAFRNRSNNPIMLDGTDVMPGINAVLNQIKEFSGKVISGKWKGYTGKNITDVVNIGIGGSSVGPYMVSEALKPFALGPNVHFVSNIDGTHLFQTLKALNAETTLFIIASKSFTTIETMTNATTAKEWFLNSAKDDSALSKHFVAISANEQGVKEFGIDEAVVFIIWKWVRYDLWSAVCLSIAIHIGYDNYEELLCGAHFMDNHFMTAPLEKNIPVIMALLGIWYHNFYGTETHAVLPYDHNLQRIPSYFQQYCMEYSGMDVTRSGRQVDYNTGTVVWGQQGTDGQHGCYELLHKGTLIIPADFIAPAKSHNHIANNLHHKILLANFLSQTEALMMGNTEDEAKAQLKKTNIPADQLQLFLPHRVFSGNRPTNSIMFEKITPFNLGALIVMYEHKTFTQDVIWDIFPFDPLGTQKSKQLAKIIESELQDKNSVSSHDPSTNGLINFIKKHL